MRRYRWQVFLVVLLTAASSVLYYFHFLVFRDVHHILIYLLGDIAFLPIEVLIVTIILHELLSSREKRARMQKLNMVIGAFFTEIGTKLLVVLSDADPELEKIKRQLLISNNWSDQAFSAVAKQMNKHPSRVDLHKLNLKELKKLIDSKKDFVIRLFENPNLLEHEAFTDLLWAISHIDEELANRKDLAQLKAVDAEHIANDLSRVYSRLVKMWVEHMKHLKINYPYLFSLAIRTNPFDETASPEIQ